jgi:hypothetical protein
MRLRTKRCRDIRVAGVVQLARLMGICGDIAWLAGPSAGLLAANASSGASPDMTRMPRRVAAVMAIALAGMLAGCTSNDSGELLIDPGRYAVYKCDDLATRWRTVSAREKELRGLMDRASQSAGGAVVGSLSYRVDYDAVISDERLLQRTAAEKNCNLPFQTPSIQAPPLQAQGAPPPAAPPPGPQYQSDQGIR